MLEKYLDELENRISCQMEQLLYSQWKQFWENQYKGDYFDPKRSCKLTPKIEWPKVWINDALEDYELMALSQFRMCSDCLAEGNGRLMNVRSNYGTSILPSIFGVEQFVMPRETDTLPTSHPIAGGIEAIKKIVNKGRADINSPLCDRALEMGRRLVEIAKKYPKIGKYIHIYHPDFQGPMDVCEVVWGSTIFYELYDNGQLVKDFLALITDAYIRLMKMWNEIVPSDNTGYATHWGMFHKGSIMLRDDSAMNVSPEMFDEFIKPYDQRLLNEFGGGAIHFCGRGDHFIKSMSTIDNLYGINISQPECNDMEIILQNTVDKGLKLFGLQKTAAQQLVAQGRNLLNSVNVWEK